VCDWKKMLLLGFVVWLVPFLAAFAFYTPKGELMVDETFFKSLMIVIGSFSGGLAAIYYFRGIKSEWAKEGAIAGAAWVAENWLLDALVLLPMAGIDVGTYFFHTGLRYFSIAFATAAVGAALEERGNTGVKAGPAGRKSRSVLPE
jgi:hypothetical protein